MARPDPEVFEGRFTGAFEIDDSELSFVEPESEVFLVVHCRVTGETLDIHPKTGVVKQISKLKVAEAGVVRTTNLRDSLCDSLGLTRPTPQLPFQSSEPDVDGRPGDEWEEVRIEETVFGPADAETGLPDTEIETEVTGPTDVVRHGTTGGSRETDPMVARFIGAS